MIRKKKKSTSLYRSGFEEKAVGILNLAKIAHEYESLKLKYVIPASNHTYTPDIILPNGIICELKGYMDAPTRNKMLFVISQNKNLDIRLVYQNEKTKITKKSKTTYAMWSEKNNIKWGTLADLIDWAKEPTVNKNY